MQNYVLDFIIVGVVVGFAIMGFIAGFSGKVLSFLSWALSATLAGFLCVPTSNYGKSFFPVLNKYDLLSDLSAFIVVFLFFLLIFSFFGKSLSSTIKKSRMGTVDRNLGLILGSILGIFFLSLLVFAEKFLLSDTHKPAFVRESKLYPFIEVCNKHVRNLGCKIFQLEE